MIKKRVSITYDKGHGSEATLFPFNLWGSFLLLHWHLHFSSAIHMKLLDTNIPKACYSLLHYTRTLFYTQKYISLLSSTSVEAGKPRYYLVYALILFMFLCIYRFSLVKG